MARGVDAGEVEILEWPVQFVWVGADAIPRDPTVIVRQRRLLPADREFAIEVFDPVSGRRFTWFCEQDRSSTRSLRVSGILGYANARHAQVGDRVRVVLSRGSYLVSLVRR